LINVWQSFAQLTTVIRFVCRIKHDEMVKRRTERWSYDKGRFKRATASITGKQKAEFRKFMDHEQKTLLNEKYLMVTDACISPVCHPIGIR
jgi:hypothetical protein